MFVDPYDESLLDIVVVDVIVASVVDGGGTVDDEDEDEDNNDDGGIVVVVVIRLLNWLLSVWFVFIIRFILFFIDNIVGRIGLRLPSSFETLNSNDECVNNGSW